MYFDEEIGSLTIPWFASGDEDFNPYKFYIEFDLNNAEFINTCGKNDDLFSEIDEENFKNKIKSLIDNSEAIDLVKKNLIKNENELTPNLV